MLLFNDSVYTGSKQLGSQLVRLKIEGKLSTSCQIFC